MARDERVVVFGEDVAAAGGVFAVTPGLYEKYGSGRVFDTPIAELALTGVAFGSAVCGLRPVIEIMFGDFLTLSMDSLINQAAKFWYISNEQAGVPLVVRSAIGAGGRFGAIHSQTPVSWFMGVPGLKIVCPSTPADAKGLLKAAVRDDNPVLFFEHKRLYARKGPVHEEVVPLGVAAVVRPGPDVTIVSVMKTVHDCLAAGRISHRRRGHRPAHGAATGPRHHCTVGRENGPPAGRRRRSAHGRLGRRGAREHRGAVDR